MKLDLKSLYKQKIVPSLIEEFGYKNIEQVPKLVKISVNRGVGEASKNSKELDSSLEELTLIVGQAPTINKASKSVAGFRFVMVCQSEPLLLYERNRCITSLQN